MRSRLAARMDRLSPPRTSARLGGRQSGRTPRATPRRAPRSRPPARRRGRAGCKGDVVGARVEVRAHGLGDRFRRAVGDDRVDQAVAAAVGDIALGEAEAQEVVGVVGAAQVERGVLARDRARRLDVCLDDDRELRRDERIRARRGSRAKRVCSGVTKYVWVPSERREARSSIFGPSAAATRSSSGTGSGAASSPSKNALILASGPTYSAVASGCPTPIPSRKRPGKARASSARCVGDVGRLVLPHVEDPGGDGQRARALEERPRLLHRRAAADPQGRRNPSASISATPSTPSCRRRQTPILPSSMGEASDRCRRRAAGDP